MTKEVEASLRRKASDFMLLTRARDTLHITLVTTYGLRQNSYSGAVQSVVTAEDPLAF